MRRACHAVPFAAPTAGLAHAGSPLGAARRAVRARCKPQTANTKSTRRQRTTALVGTASARARGKHALRTLSRAMPTRGRTGAFGRPCAGRGCNGPPSASWAGHPRMARHPRAAAADLARRAEQPTAQPRLLQRVATLAMASAQPAGGLAGAAFLRNLLLRTQGGSLGLWVQQACQGALCWLGCAPKGPAAPL